MMRTAIVLLVLSLPAVGQVPQAPVGLNIALDYRQAIATPNTPELPILFSWLPSAGAVTYNVYEAKHPFTNSCGPAPATPDKPGITVTNYADNPNPGWWTLPMTDGRWKERAWCYWVSAVNAAGQESTLAGPVTINVGNGGYVYLGFRGPGTYSKADICAGGPKLNPPSSNLSDYKIEIAYDSGDGVYHDFQLQTLFDGGTVAALWHAPSIAADGFVIPWGDAKGRYVYRFTYNHHSVVGFWSPRAGQLWNYYTQVNVDMLLDPGKADDGAQCANSYFGTYDAMENVVTQ